MDFFAAGGFQQLFSDLNEQPMDFDTDTTDACAFGVLEHDGAVAASYECVQHFELNVDYDFYDNANGLETTNNVDFMNYANSDEVSNTELPDTFLLDLNIANQYNAKDYNNNVNEFEKYSEKSLQYSLDLLLPADATQTQITDLDKELEADALITQEIAEWEEKFLDNYIEIPELIEILPEKTPLCTEVCELFLEESSQNLKLYRKKRSKPKLKTKTEDNDKGYQCTYDNCRKMYAKPAHLKAHIRRHMGEKPYACTWPDCTWKFSRSDELARHRRSHSGIKPYKCDYCTKCFARSDHLTKHRKVHERRLLAATKAGSALNGVIPQSILTVRPGRKRKNQF
ncbi:Krueppel-like factor 7 [Teleopsis dalmanni]|uniref:Krueppel-like factor 7 n=1 Tax=Teleopsis dalmanni TaxID=139649 RepID=UPI0018CCC5AD|nr:Krueppel-like factor 7 [Teleopsis dalmanni]